MGVNVDPAGSNEETVSVDGAGRARRDATNFNNATSTNPDIGSAWRNSRTVDDRPAAYHQIEFAHATLHSVDVANRGQ